MRTAKYCRSAVDIPKIDHFVILDFRSISIPGDERSRTNPGHGYPASTEQIVDYIAFTDEDEWKKEITSRMTSPYGKKEFVALLVKSAQITMTTNISIQ